MKQRSNLEVIKIQLELLRVNYLNTKILNTDCEGHPWVTSDFFEFSQQKSQLISKKIYSENVFINNIFFILQIVLVHLNWSKMVSVMMKPTLQTATLMEVTAVEVVPTLIIVQIVYVMQGHQQVLTVSKNFNLF